MITCGGCTNYANVSCSLHCYLVCYSQHFSCHWLVIAVVLKIYRFAHENHLFFLFGKLWSRFKECKGQTREVMSCVWSLISHESASEWDAGQPRRHLLTTGWSAFVNKKKLVSGDAVLFLR
jgi:hypothetical protein